MEIYQFLARAAIRYERCDHDPVYTSEQANRLVPALPGVPAKNLFLRDKKGVRHFLLVFEDTKSLDLKRLAAELGTAKLSLASEARLAQYLDVEAGAVSLLALVNDPLHRVEVLIDQEIWQAEALQCHPLVNTSTLVIPMEDIAAFLKATGHCAVLIDLGSSAA